MASSLAGRARLLREDETGTVAMMFALSIVIVFGMVGGAIDYGRAASAREQIQNAVDASVLAAVRVWQTERDVALAQEKGLEYYNKNKPSALESAVSGFSSDAQRNSIVMEAQATVPAPFLALLRGGRGYTVSARSEALLAIGGNAGSNLEISLMLDVTGSMAGTKIDDLKVAAKDLVDIVVWDDQSEYSSRIAIVPFAQAVHLGSTALVDHVRGGVKKSSCLAWDSPCTSYANASPSATQWTWGSPATWFRWSRADGFGTRTHKASSYCVTERVGANRFTDEAPNNGSDKVGPLYAGLSSTDEQANCSLVDSADMEVNSIQPLTNDKDLLKRRIGKLELAGSTAGQIGTAWAWYMLSPKWAHLWPAESRPKAYGSPKLQKIAILMTDGEYNTAYCNGVLAKDSGVGSNSSQINCNATNGQAHTQATSLCTAMKSGGTGITVYTIGFALGGNATAISTLRNCASDESKFYEATDGEALRQAFRDIALQIARLRLTQ
ncbi:MAG: TadE/TadG family type IV pilus assembly protein [Hyphomicrobiaceae bacterium]|nr:TadE/TadG family type IV pilus assembly protein [Hyphomicrobiaceae bacterium]